MEAYAYKNVDEYVRIASSGGAFRRIFETIASISEECIVYGAAWTKNLSVEHRRISSKQSINELSGSKYIRSAFKQTIPLLKDDLIEGRTVVFSGTPCQINSVIKILEKEGISDKNLYTIDVICHGTPEPRIWHDCVSWTEKKYKSRIRKVSFRDKRIGWKGYPTTYTFENGKEITANYESQLFIRLFMSSLITNRGCFSCPYSNMNRISDITIGDFWGVEDAIPQMTASSGVSLVLANSEKGRSILDRINKAKDKNEVLIRVEAETFLKHQRNLNEPTKKPDNYDLFWKDYNEYGFEHVIRKYSFYTTYRKMRFWGRKLLNRFLEKQK